MIQEQIPVRLNNPITHSYQFLDQDRTVISLSTYVYVFLEIKLQGQVFQSVSAQFDNQTQGTVKLVSYAYTTTGIWTAQFYCVDGFGNKLWGEPVQFRVVPNVEDLGLSDLAKY